MVAIAQLAGVPDLLATRTSSGFSPAEVDALALDRTAAHFFEIWSAGLLLFGVHQMLIGYLICASGQMPRTLESWS